MRSFSLLIASFTLLGASPAWACDGDVVFRQPPQQALQQVTQRTPQQLIADAQQLESQALSKETIAVSLEKEATDDDARAQAMRTAAASKSGGERELAMARADGLSAQAMVLRSQATQRRAEASAMRDRARELRVRAQGGGWHRRAV